MIVASLLLILGAAGLLGLGLWQSSSILLSGSIAGSLLSAIVLVVANRRARPPRRPASHRAASGGRTPAAQLPAAAGAPAEPVTMTIPVQAGVPGRNAPAGQDADRLEPDPADPPDEPAPQQVSAADAARVGRMLTEVLVVDGRPRYHLPGCVHLLGRQNESLPVGEAVELGFTPCSLCEPDSALLADARRV